MKSLVKKVAIALSGFALLSGAAHAQIFNVPARGEQKIDRHGTCRIVKNTGSTAVMVPTNRAQEWSVGSSSFLQNISNMAGVSAESCAGPWAAANICSPNADGNCVIIDYWGVGSYAIVINGEIDRSCLNPNNARTGPSKRLTAAEKAIWLDYAKNPRHWAGYGYFSGMYKYHNDSGFTDDMAAKAVYWCNILPDGDTWYNGGGNVYDLASILNEPGYAWRVGPVLRKKQAYPGYENVQDHVEVWTHQLLPN